MSFNVLTIHPIQFPFPCLLLFYYWSGIATDVFLPSTETSQTLGFYSLRIKQIHRWDEENDSTASQNPYVIGKDFQLCLWPGKFQQKPCGKHVEYFCAQCANDRNSRCNLYRKIINSHLGISSSYFTNNFRNIGSWKWSLCKTQMLIFNRYVSNLPKRMKSDCCLSLSLCIHLYFLSDGKKCK